MCSSSQKGRTMNQLAIYGWNDKLDQAETGINL